MTTTLRTDPSTWDTAYVDARLTEYCKTYPDRLNPVRDGGTVGESICVYQNGRGQRCLIGQFLHDHGLLTAEIIAPNRPAGLLNELIPQLDGTVARRLGKWQHAADRLTSEDKVGWGAVPSKVAKS